MKIVFGKLKKKRKDCVHYKGIRLSVQESNYNTDQLAELLATKVVRRILDNDVATTNLSLSLKHFVRRKLVSCVSHGWDLQNGREESTIKSKFRELYDYTSIWDRISSSPELGPGTWYLADPGRPLARQKIDTLNFFKVHPTDGKIVLDQYNDPPLHGVVDEFISLADTAVTSDPPQA